MNTTEDTPDIFLTFQTFEVLTHVCTQPGVTPIPVGKFTSLKRKQGEPTEQALQIFSMHL